MSLGYYIENLGFLKRIEPFVNFHYDFKYTHFSTMMNGKLENYDGKKAIGCSW